MKDFKKLREKGARLITITAINQNTLMYHFVVEGRREDVQVKVRGDKAESLCKTFPNAELYEREIHEMFGISFKGHPDLRGLFLSKDAPKTPLRKS